MVMGRSMLLILRPFSNWTGLQEVIFALPLAVGLDFGSLYLLMAEQCSFSGVSNCLKL